eukprot:TRINITY_DN7432_c0_g1_i4.p2 TRINITY_DN7432_c0_g1~~TRINITY_DN7432_c0_g1_i4.p2  ORF type:complete len:328 (+),score=57.00 TRINITY_DN7432_c0_g1_i4:215-1198(+)
MQNRRVPEVCKGSVQPLTMLRLIQPLSLRLSRSLMYSCREPEVCRGGFRTPTILAAARTAAVERLPPSLQIVAEVPRELEIVPAGSTQTTGFDVTNHVNPAITFDGSLWKASPGDGGQHSGPGNESQAALLETDTATEARRQEPDADEVEDFAGPAKPTKPGCWVFVPEKACPKHSRFEHDLKGDWGHDGWGEDWTEAASSTEECAIRQRALRTWCGSDKVVTHFVALGAGHCKDASNKGRWIARGKAEMSDDMQHCEGACWGITHCITNCIKGRRHYSRECAQCFGELGSCSREHCHDICEDKASCQVCIKRNCRRSWVQCTGFSA